MCHPRFSFMLQGTHARMGEFVFIEEEKYSEKSGIGWYRSKEPIPIKHPFVGGGYISNKKWPLIEESTM